MGVDSFDSIFHRAAERKGGASHLEALLPTCASEAELTSRGDDRYLAEMTRCVFRSGFVWQIIERKWPDFEDAFGGFDVNGCAMLSEEDLERLSGDDRIVRNAIKIRSVPANAAFILDVRADHGSFGAYLAAWPASDFTGLWQDLKKRGQRLGGQTGRYFLRFMGKDTPVLSADVLTALAAQGVIDKEPTSRRAMARVQEAFDTWREQSGRDLCQISRVLACTV